MQVNEAFSSTEEYEFLMTSVKPSIQTIISKTLLILDFLLSSRSVRKHSRRKYSCDATHESIRDHGRTCVMSVVPALAGILACRLTGAHTQASALSFVSSAAVPSECWDI